MSGHAHGLLAALCAVFCTVTATDARAGDGPCEQPGAIGAIVDRPGLGKPTANNGSPCVVPASRVVVEAGVRAQATTGAGGISMLGVFPLALIRAGLGARSELIVQPPSAAERGGAALGGTFVPAAGAQDAGAGVKRMLDDRTAFQDAVEVFYTAPTGVPQGPVGFSAGGPTYTLSYTAAVALNPRLALSLTQNAIAGAAPNDPAGATRFFSYQPSLTLGYALSTRTTLLLTDQISAPPSPGSGTGNRVLLALQRVLSPDAVVDVEFEVNALPSAPAFRQRAFGGGTAVMF